MKIVIDMEAFGVDDGSTCNWVEGELEVSVDGQKKVFPARGNDRGLNFLDDALGFLAKRVALPPELSEAFTEWFHLGPWTSANGRWAFEISTPKLAHPKGSPGLPPDFMVSIQTLENRGDNVHYE